MKPFKPPAPVAPQPIVPPQPIFNPPDAPKSMGVADDYDKAACEALGIPFYKDISPTKIYHFLGFVLIDDSADAVDAIVQLYEKKTRQYGLFLFAQYLDGLKRIRQIQSEIRKVERFEEDERLRYDKHLVDHDHWRETELARDAGKPSRAPF